MSSLFEIAVSNALLASGLALLVFGLSLVWRPPALLHCLWLLVLLRLVMPPVISVSTQLPRLFGPGDVRLQLSVDEDSPSAAGLSPEALESVSSEALVPVEHVPVEAPAASAGEAGNSAAGSVAGGRAVASRTGSGRTISLVQCLICVWVAGAVFCLGRSLWGLLRFQRLLRFADPADERINALVERHARAMQLRRVPRVLVLPGAISPMLWISGRRAQLLFPRQLLEELSDDALETVIVHELAHYRRGDHWVRRLELVVSSIFWWHPLVWLAVRELRRVEEACCDAWVVSQLPEQRGVYARTLVQAVGLLTARPSAMPAVSGVLGKGFYRSLEQRVQSIMSQSPRSGVRLTPAMTVGLVLFALVVLPLFPATGEDALPGTSVAQNNPSTASEPARAEDVEPTSFAGGGLVELGSINDVAVSKDGRLLAVAHGIYSGPGAFSLWDLKTRQLVGSTQEDRRVMDVAFSPDGQLVGYGTMGNAVRVRRTDTLAIAQDLSGFKHENVYVAFSGDGRKFAVAQQQEIQIYDTQTWRKLPTEFHVADSLPVPEFLITRIDFSPDGASLAAGGMHTKKDDKMAWTTVFETETGKARFTVPHKYPVAEVAYSPDGTQILSGSGTFYVIDAQDGTVIRELSLKKTPAYHAGWSPDGQQVVAAGALTGCATFDVKTAALSPFFDPPPYPKANRAAACFTPDGRQIISGGLDKVVRVYDADSRKLVLQFPSSGGDQTNDVPLLAVAAAPDGRWIACAREDGSISLHDPKGGALIKVLKGHGDIVSYVAFSPDGTLASASYDQTIKLWDCDAGTETKTLAGHENWVFGLAFSADGKSLASAGYDKTVRLWNVADGTEAAKLEGHTAGVRDVAFSTDGKRLASASSDRMVKVWDLESRTAVQELKGHTGTVRAVAFSPDGNWLASAAEDSTVRLWKTGDWQEAHKLEGHQGMVWALAFSAGSRNLVTGGFDNTVKVWDPSTGQLRQTLQGHRDAVTGVAFLPGTTGIISTGMDRALRIWPADRKAAN